MTFPRPLLPLLPLKRKALIWWLAVLAKCGNVSARRSLGQLRRRRKDLGSAGPQQSGAIPLSVLGSVADPKSGGAA